MSHPNLNTHGVSVYPAGLLTSDRPVVFADQAEKLAADLLAARTEAATLRCRLMQAHAYLLSEWRANALRGHMGQPLIDSLTQPV